MSASAVAIKLQAKRHGKEPRVTSNFGSLAEVRKAMLTKLKDSTLTEADAQRLGMTPYTAQDVAKHFRELTFQRAGFQIPYYTIQGQRTKFYRFRYLEYDNARGFGRLVHSSNGSSPLKHDIRYVQPANTLPQVYFAPSIPWAKIAKAKDVILTITEGELKAACACKNQMPCIGLGGVWSFKSAKAGLHLLPELKEFTWTDRVVYICYDSDAITNPDVCAAENALAHELVNCGATVYICRLPALGGKKTGLDDYIAQRGKEAFEKEIRDTAQEYLASEELFKLNGEVVYVRDPGLIMRLDTLQRMTPRAFVEHQYANRIWYMPVNGADGKPKAPVEKCAPREWLKWPHRATVERVTYQPGEGRFLLTGELNVWPRWGVEPAKGDVSKWLEYLDYVFADHEDRAQRIQWFQQWLAYPLQHPGTKLNQSVVMWSVAQGTGKSVIGYTMQQIYGRNFAEINDRHLQGSFNSWAENKQFVMGDEIASTGDKRRDTADRMKSIITQKELHINTKYVPEYVVPDCINYYFTSNHCDAFFVDDTDRRFFINEIKRRPKPNEWYNTYCEWALRGPGAAAIFQHLLDFDCSTFNPQAPAPVTSSKAEMITNTQTDAAMWVTMLREDPDQVLRIGDVPVPYKLWTAGELFRILDPEGRGRLSINGLSRELRKAGFRQLRDGTLIRTINGLQRIWAIRDRDAMHLLQQPKLIAAEYANERKNKAKGAKY